MCVSVALTHAEVWFFDLATIWRCCWCDDRVGGLTKLFFLCTQFAFWLSFVLICCLRHFFNIDVSTEISALFVSTLRVPFRRRTRTSYFHCEHFPIRIVRLVIFAMFGIHHWMTQVAEKKRNRTSFIINSPFVCYCRFVAVAFVQCSVHKPIPITAFIRPLFSLYYSILFSDARHFTIKWPTANATIWNQYEMWCEWIGRLKSLSAFSEIIKKI